MYRICSILMMLLGLCVFTTPVHAFEYRLGIIHEKEEKVFWEPRWKEAETFAELFETENIQLLAIKTPGGALVTRLRSGNRQIKIAVRNYIVDPTIAATMATFSGSVSALYKIRIERTRVPLQPLDKEKPLTVNLLWEPTANSTYGRCLLTEYWLAHVVFSVDGTTRDFVYAKPNNVSHHEAVELFELSFLAFDLRSEHLDRSIPEERCIQHK